MNRVNQVEPSQGLIRRFSDDISESSPGESLCRALAAKVAFDRNQERTDSLRDEWDQLLLQGREFAQGFAPDEDAVLLQQSQRLHAAWSKFRKNLPEEQQIRLGDCDRPDIKFLVATVNKASATWQSDREESKLGKLKSKFRSLCETCNDHSALLAIFPKDEKYVTLLTGSLSAIAQATINHQKIAEAVADTLDDLSHDIDFWNRQMLEHGKIPALRPYIQELYVVVFEFFTEIFTKWSKSGWKRFLISFDEGAFNRLFTSKKNRLLAIEQRMERHINLDFRHNTAMRLETLIQSQERLLNILPCELSEQRLFLGQSLQKFLEQQQFFRLEPPQPTSTTSMVQGTSRETLSDSTGDASDLALPEPEVHPARPAYFRFNRAEIQAELTTFTNQWKNHIDYLIQTTNRASLLRLDKDVHHRLVAWLRGPNSANLWIQGPHGMPQPSQNSMTAVSLAALARSNNIPCIVYFCTFADQTPSRISKKVELGSLLASIVTQLVQFIPDKGYAEADLFPERFAALARGALDVVETVQLIRDVRNVGPRLVYGFVDNIQVLEDRADGTYNRDFLRVIASLCRLGGRSQLSETPVTPNEEEDEESVFSGTRICFTTDGYVDGLAQAAELQLVDRVEFDLETNERLGEEAGGILGWDTEGRDD